VVEVNKAGPVKALRGVGAAAILIGALGSISSMLHAGRHQQSRLLITLFCGWVLSPFLGAAGASLIAKRWAVITQATLHTAAIILTLGSLAIYGSFTFGYTKAKVGFVFLVVPLASWLFLAVSLSTSALIATRQSHRQNTS
jgi:hypothetical protein